MSKGDGTVDFIYVLMDLNLCNLFIQSSPYHIMYAAIGDISDEEKEAIMEEGFSTIEEVDRMGHIHTHQLHT